MTDFLQFTGTLQSTPTDPSASAQPSVLAQIAESLVLKRLSDPGQYDLTADAAVPISLGAIANVNVLMVKVTGGPVTLRVTSAAGATQSIPVDSFFYVMTGTVPITAIDVTRSPGVETFVDVILGEAA
jgi:hypothetical protein